MSKSEEDKLVEHVERVNNAPVVLSQYGFKIIEFDGKKYLSPLTEQEHISGIALSSGISEDEVRANLKPSEARCYMDSVSLICMTAGGCRYCQKVHWGGGNWTCDAQC